MLSGATPRLSACESLKDQAAVGAPKAERIRQRILDLHLPGMIGHIVEVALRVRELVINGRRCDLVAQSQHGDASLQASRATQQVAGHRFRGTYGQLVGMLAEGA